MNVINPVTTEDGTPRSFYSYRISFERMCSCIAKLPGVTFTERRRFMWSGENAVARFQLNGHSFKIESIWADIHVCPEDDVSAFPEIVVIQEHVERNGLGQLRRWLVQLFKNKTKQEMPTTPRSVRR